MSAIRTAPPAVHYPDSDGQPMSDNTLQFDWIAILKWNAEAQFRTRPDVFVAGDHLIYAVEGSNTTRQAPDVYVAFGRPKGYRGSYKVWEEGGVFPQVVFEVWSPHNRHQQMEDKKAFYERYGVEEYYIVYPDFPAYAEGWRRDGDTFVRIPDMNGLVSPRLKWRFLVVKGDLVVIGPDGQPLRRPDDTAAERDAEKARADAEKARADAEKARADALAAKLRALGLDPDAP